MITKCDCCGAVLKWGELTYRQEKCWPCFVSHVLRIKDSLGEEDGSMVYHLLAVMAEINGFYENGKIKLYK